MTRNNQFDLAFFFIMLGLVVAVIMTTMADGAERELCTWQIAYYALGERVEGKSKHGWHLTADERAQLFGPFLSGSLPVEPGYAWFECNGKRVNILTAPLPQGSLLLLKDK